MPGQLVVVLGFRDPRVDLDVAVVGEPLGIDLAELLGAAGPKRTLNAPQAVVGEFGFFTDPTSKPSSMSCATIFAEWLVSAS